MTDYEGDTRGPERGKAEADVVGGADEASCVCFLVDGFPSVLLFVGTIQGDSPKMSSGNIEKKQEEDL